MVQSIVYVSDMIYVRPFPPLLSAFVSFRRPPIGSESVADVDAVRRQARPTEDRRNVPVETEDARQRNRKALCGCKFDEDAYQRKRKTEGTFRRESRIAEENSSSRRENAENSIDTCVTLAASSTLHVHRTWCGGQGGETSKFTVPRGGELVNFLVRRRD